MEHDWQKTPLGPIDALAYVEYDIDSNHEHQGPICLTCGRRGCLPCLQDLGEDLWDPERFPCPGPPPPGHIYYPNIIGDLR